MGTRNFVPNDDEEGNIGSAAKRWLKGWFVSFGVKYFDFDISAAVPSLEEGRVYYDPTEHALAYYNDEIPVELGQKNVIRVYNDSGADIAKGMVVYASGVEATEGRLKVELAEASTDATARVIGAASGLIEDGGFGYVTSSGYVEEIDTSSFAAGDILYLSDSTPGELQNTAPVAPNNIIEIGYCMTVNASGVVLIATNVALGDFLPLAGGTMTGNIEIGSNRITNGAASIRATTAALIYEDNAANQMSLAATFGHLITYDNITGYTSELRLNGGFLAGNRSWTAPADSGVLALFSEITAANAGAIPTSEKGVANGVAELDATGKVPEDQLPTQLMHFKGNWDASTNTPTLSNTDTDVEGYTYRCSADGTVDFGAGNIEFKVGDWVYNNGTIWSKGDNTDQVASVFGRAGVVVAQAGDYTADQVTNAFDKSSDTSDDVTEGTVNLFLTATLKEQLETIGSLRVDTPATTSVSNGSYTVLADTTAADAHNTNLTQDADWSIEYEGTNNVKKTISANFSPTKIGGGAQEYDFAIFKNGSLLYELVENRVWNGSNTAIQLEITDLVSNGDIYSVRVSGNGTTANIQVLQGSLNIY